MRRKSKKSTKRKNYFLHQKYKFKKPQQPLVEKPPLIHIANIPRKLKEELNRSDIIHAISLLLHSYILRNSELRKSRNSHNASSGPRLFNSPEQVRLIPPEEDIKTFIQSIFDKRRLPLEAGIIALILLNRTSIKLHSQNWMRLVLISLLLANKLTEDVYSVYNAKFLGLIPNLENLEINVLELEFLQYLKYRLFIETETYLRYYAKLRKFFPEEDDDDENDDEEEEVTEVGVMEDVCPVLDCGSRWQDFNFDLVGSIA
jgi:hypothetical protein